MYYFVDFVPMTQPRRCRTMEDVERIGQEMGRMGYTMVEIRKCEGPEWPEKMDWDEYYDRLRIWHEAKKMNTPYELHYFDVMYDRWHDEYERKKMEERNRARAEKNAAEALRRKETR